MPPAACPTVLCNAVAVTAETPVHVEHDGTAYAVFLLGNRPYVAQDACTHGPGSLAEGYIDGDEVECPFHQGRFHIPTGRPTAPHRAVRPACGRRKLGMTGAPMTTGR
jgi:nitrite reductase/ring-hydroxylating ferredoxin subunit